jgi:hypothetical protein
MRLEGIVLFLFAGASILSACMAVTVSPFFLVALSRFERMRRGQANPRSAFLKKLLRGVAKKAVQDIGDVHNAYRAFLGISTLRASHLQEIAEFLRRAEVQIASAPPGVLHGCAQENTQLLHGLLAMNQRALEVELQCAPFSGTPEPERQLLEEILALTMEDKTRVSAKLDALAKAIRTRQDTVERLGLQGGRSLRLARWGWIGTLGFSILSIILGVLALGR